MATHCALCTNFDTVFPFKHIKKHSFSISLRVLRNPHFNSKTGKPKQMFVQTYSFSTGTLPKIGLTDGIGIQQSQVTVCMVPTGKCYSVFESGKSQGILHNLLGKSGNTGKMGKILETSTKWSSEKEMKMPGFKTYDLKMYWTNEKNIGKPGKCRKSGNHYSVTVPS